MSDKKYELNEKQLEYVAGGNNGNGKGNGGNNGNGNSESWKYYTVVSGDCLSVLAQRFGVTVTQLVEWNNISNPDLIYIGQELRYM